MDLQTIFNAVLLGIVEGLTEFIPVSSTGHLLLTQQLLGLTGPNWETFTVLIQLGAILAVVVVYFARLWSVVISLPSKPEARRFAITVILGCLPAFALGFLLHDYIKKHLFESPELICWTLLIGGFVLLAIDRLAPKPVDHDSMKLPIWKSIVIGLFQCLSLVPGVSRSGSTIVGSMLMGIDKRAAAEFSFFLAIPIMVGAFALDLIKSRDELTSSNLGVIAIGFVVSFIVALAVIRVLLGFVQKRGFWPFGIWRILVGGVGLAVIHGLIPIG
jgi:undecaprenyl-diphosphatase